MFRDCLVDRNSAGSLRIVPGKATSTIAIDDFGIGAFRGELEEPRRGR